MSILFLLLGALALSFLVFIHELGHFFVARHVGMRVEVFSIGFGKPFYSWVHKGVKWQICFLIFGGYVKIAGMDKDGEKEPHEIEDGFFGKPPIDRIKVALMGPIVNIVFALLAFTAIWSMGGRDRPFSEFTRVIGYVDPKSELYEKGVRPGDTIDRLGDRAFSGFKDLMYNAVVDEQKIQISGEKIDYFTGDRTPYHYVLSPYPDSRMPKKFKTIGVQSPAGFSTYFESPEYQTSPASPLYNKGLEVGDHILWASGDLIFSLPQMREVVNRPFTYLTIERKGKVQHFNIPRLKLLEFDIQDEVENTFDDWRYELGLQGELKQFYFIPYYVNANAVVVSSATFLDPDFDRSLEKSVRELRSGGFLQAGDRILAVNGTPIEHGRELMQQLQSQSVVVIAAKAPSEIDHQPITSLNQDDLFTSGIDWANVHEMIRSVGTDAPVHSLGNLKLLQPIRPLTVLQFQQLAERAKDTTYFSKVQLAEFAANAITQTVSSEDERFMRIGAPFKEQQVVYNPTPFKLFADVCVETYYMFKGLISGSLSPKWMTGPVGIVQVMQHGWSLGIKEALYFMGLISLNLGLLNLLPVPVFDGGHICFSIYEMITKKRISAKTMERLVIPFVVLLVMFFVYVTIYDVLRIAGLGKM